MGFWSVGRKTTAAALVLIAVATVASVTWQSNCQRVQLESQALENWSTVTILIAQQLHGAVRWKKPKAVEAIYMPLATQDSSAVSAVAVFDGAGAALSIWQSAPDALLPDYVETSANAPLAVTKSGSHLTISAPITNPTSGAHIGSVTMQWSLKSVRKMVQDAILHQALAAVGIALLLVLTLHQLNRRVLSVPLAEAVAFCRAIARGRVGSTLTPRSSDEIGALTQTLNDMQAELQARAEHDQQQAEEIARLQHAAEAARIKQALDSVTASVMMTDAQNEVVYVNPALVNMFPTAETALRSAWPGFDAARLQGSNLCNMPTDGIDPEAVKPQQALATLGGRTFRCLVNPLFSDDGNRLG